MDDALLTEAPLGLEGLLDSLPRPSQGAVVVFLGCVRDRERGRPIRSIRYEAYAGMAEGQLAVISREARERYGARVLIRHRLGRVPVKEASLLVACAAPHRREAFDAARFVVDRIKKDVTIWKVEFEGEALAPARPR